MIGNGREHPTRISKFLTEYYDDDDELVIYLAEGEYISSASLIAFAVSNYPTVTQIQVFTGRILDSGWFRGKDPSEWSKVIVRFPQLGLT